MKIATWNINGITSRLQHVIDWSARNDPDVLCLQELKCVDAKFPHQKLKAAGFPHIEFHGEKSYNGVAILSKHPINDLQKNFPGDADDAPRRLIAGTVEGVRIVNVYAPHGTKMASDKFKFKLDWLARLRDHFDKNFDTEDDVILCGDLNVAPHEMDVWKPSLWKDKLHFSKPERDTLLSVKRWGFADLFRQLNDDIKEFSWWSNFHHDFEKDRGLRIDFIWASPPIAESCTDCWIDKEPRALEKPSDHAPVVAVLDI
ncbi:MAG: exodeoxyribonuclease III [Acidobacteria bacterium]|nr:exodeoxyribonuclease III [Acidobacteriota bacterium]